MINIRVVVLSSKYSEAGFLGVIIRRDLWCNCSMSERGGSIEHSATEKRVTHLVSGISVRHVVQSHGTHRGEMARVVTTTKLQKKKVILMDVLVLTKQ